MSRKILVTVCTILCFVFVGFVQSEEVKAFEVFSDVYADDWYAQNLYTLVDNGIISGYPDGTFGPDNNITRSECISILSRIDGDIDNSDTNVFSDVNDDHWAINAIIWGVENDIISGCGDGTFKPDNFITRQELATMLTKYIKYKGLTFTETTRSPLIDIDSCGDWAVDNVKFLYDRKIINGYIDNTFKPTQNTTRAEFITLMQNILQLPVYDGYIGEARPVEPVETYEYIGTYKGTFYCPCYRCNGSSNGITASGTTVTPYRTIAVRGIPFGTKLKLEFSQERLQHLNGIYIVEDRCASSGVIDLCVESHSQCYDLGVDRGLKVYIVK